MEIQQCRETLAGLQEACQKETDEMDEAAATPGCLGPPPWRNSSAAAASQPGGGGAELQECYAALDGLGEGYYRERGNLETGVPVPVVAGIMQAGSPTMPSREGSDTETDEEIRAFRAAKAP